MPTKKIKLSESEKKELMTSIKKIIGQLQAVSYTIETDKVTSSTFTQLLAVKGGASKVCKDIISKGVLGDLKNYSMEELDSALNVIFKLD
jgi:DNA-binding FrmR family transcriptional regulator